MPKGQLSFEFLLYIAVSAAALVAVLAIYGSSGAMQRATSAAIYMEELAALINGNMAYQTSSFYAYVPPAICNVTKEQMPVSAIGGFALLDGVYISNSLCASTGEIEKLALGWNYDGTYTLSSKQYI